MSIYDYKNNIKVLTSVHGDKVIAMNEEIYTTILVHIYEAHEAYQKQGLEGLNKDTLELWKALKDKQ